VAKVLGKLLKKKLGFRTVMDIIPIDASLIKGSHGRLTEDEKDFPILISNQKYLESEKVISPINVRKIIENHLIKPN